ncbi:MAG: hypothetical protein VXW87_01390 [Pseudomonadota bacterium]|nr:hypothetical protein [Pseudomonadota bacterium]
MMDGSSPSVIKALWVVFEQMIQITRESLPEGAILRFESRRAGDLEEEADGCHEHAGQAIFEAVYLSCYQKAVLAVWQNQFPRTAGLMKANSEGDSYIISLDAQECAEQFYHDCLPHELNKRVYKYALKGISGASQALVEYWKTCWFVAFESVSASSMISEWIAIRANLLEPRILMFKVAIDYSLGDLIGSYNWYWVCRLRILSDMRKNQISGVFSMVEWMKETITAYLTTFGLSYEQWEETLYYHSESIRFALKIFSRLSADYQPLWLREVVSVSAQEILPKEDWHLVDLEIMTEMQAAMGNSVLDMHNIPFQQPMSQEKSESLAVGVPLCRLS